MTGHLVDVASYQGALSIDDVIAAGFGGVNLKISHGTGTRSVHPDVAGWARRAVERGLTVCTFHFLDASAPGADQALCAHTRLAELGLEIGTAHQVDCESDATEAILREYVTTMTALLDRPVAIYTGDWWWTAPGRRWQGATLSPYLWAAPNNGYPGHYPGDVSEHWAAGYGGWPELSIMQYAVGPLVIPGRPPQTISVSKSAIRNPRIWRVLTGGTSVRPVCDLEDLEHFAGQPVADPWADPAQRDWHEAPARRAAPRAPLDQGDARTTRAAWVVVPSLNALLAELNRVAPDRDKASDGSIGDYQHSTGTSGHNPDDTPGTTAESTDADSIPEVRARDFDADLRVSGLTMERVCQYLITECRAGRITWIKYVIFNARIWSASSGWVTKTYNGANPHDKHMHVSSKSDTASENDTRPVGLASLVEDDVSEADVVNALKSAAGKTAAAQATWGTDNVIAAPGNPGPGTNPDGTPVNTHWTPSAYLQNTYQEAKWAREAARSARDDLKLLQTALLAAIKNADDGEAVITAVRAESAKLAQQATANEVNDAATAAAVASAAAELRAIRQVLETSGGDPDLVPVLERLEALPDLIRTTGTQAGEAAAASVLTRLADAQEAEAQVLRGE